MEKLITVKYFKQIHQTAKAVLVEIEQKRYWFPISKIEITGDVLKVDSKTFENKNPIIEKEIDRIKIFSKVEDYSEKVYKIVVKIKREDFESEKFLFIPKSQIETVEEGFLIIPKWVWEEKINQIKKQESEYYNNNYEDKVLLEDYKVFNGVDWF